MRKLAFVSLFLVVFAASVVCPVAAAEQKMSFSIATGGTGGVWYPLGGSISSVVNQKVPGSQLTAESTTAAVDNLKLLVNNKVGIAFCDDYQIALINEGKLPAVSDKKPVRLIMPLYDQPLQIVTKEGSGITKLADLKGKRVSTGAPNSGTEVLAEAVLKGLGLDWNKDISREKLGAKESVDALKDGKIAAAFWSGAVPTSSIIDLAATPGLKMVIIPIAGADAEKIMKANPLVFHKSLINKGSYQGLGVDVDTLGTATVLATMESLPADQVEKIIAIIFDSKPEISAIWKGINDLTPTNSLTQVSEDIFKFLHPGAKKYFKANTKLKID
ncbi:MAG: TAXI family TRAP transporter solute-binding subunit [Syntrophobacteraceae bacterium]